MRQAMVRLCSKFCKNPDSWIRIRIAQKLVMCSSLLLNTWEEMSSEECQQHASLGCFSPSPGSLHRISRLEGEEGSQCSRVAPLFGMLLPWPPARHWYFHHSVEALKGQIRSGVLHLEMYLIPCTVSSKLMHYTWVIFFIKHSCILHDCRRKILLKEVRPMIFSRR